MTDLAWIPLKLGADVVQRLLPHRRPFLLVDQVEAFTRPPRPALRARKLVSANEPVFDGHFPGLSLWPGVYTLEGLGQTANLLTVLLHLVGAFAAKGASEDELEQALRGLEQRARPGARRAPAREADLLAALGTPESRMGFAGAYDVKLTEPVYAGSVLTYQVVLTHSLANAQRFEVEARVDDRTVARGSLTSATP
jgi:3-hydroxyacyl-[acyl-carrier-protein] dehydratase